MAAIVAQLQTPNSLVDLLVNRLPWESAAGAKAAIVAKVAAPGGHGSVYVGAGKTGINADALHAVTENAP
jgi:hypothetical protein